MKQTRRAPIAAIPMIWRNIIASIPMEMVTVAMARAIAPTSTMNWAPSMRDMMQEICTSSNTSNINFKHSNLYIIMKIFTYIYSLDIYSRITTSPQNICIVFV